MYTYKKKNNVLTVIIFSCISSIITFSLTYIIMTNSNQVNNNVNQKISYEQNDGSSNIENEVNQDDEADVFEKSIDSVVGISVLSVDTNTLFEQNNTSSMNMGSGIIVSSNGYIVTNQHVAGKVNNKVYVTLNNGSTYNGITKWIDSVLDLAIIKIDISNLPSAKLGDSDNLKLGNDVYAIGNPLGLDFQRTITSGIVSALNRTIKITENNTIGYMQDLIQTDASINPGNSGGPLINESGEVIGINTIKVTEAEGIGFAIPINIVKPIIQEYVDNDSFEEAYLGIFAYDNKLLKYIDSSRTIDTGICVANIDKNGPLKASKLRVGNMLISIDNNELNTMIELRRYLYTKKPLDNIVIKYIDSNNNIVEETITLGKK